MNITMTFEQFSHISLLRSIVECFYHRASDGFHQLWDVIFGQTTGGDRW